MQTLAFAADGRLATGSHDCTARVWDRDGALLHTLTGHAKPIQHLAFAPDGALLVTGAEKGAVGVWSRNGLPLAMLDIPGGLAGGLAVTDTGLIVTGAGDGTVRIWDRDGRQLYALPSHHHNGISTLALAPNGRLITVDSDGDILLWPAPLLLPGLIADAQRCNLPPLAPAIRHRWMLPDALAQG